MSDGNKVIGFFATKGGVGKTSLALNLAYALTEGGKVLLVEMDTNRSLTATLKMEMGTFGEYAESGEVKTHIGRLYFVAKGEPFAGAELEMLQGWDYVVFDFHNSLSGVVQVLKYCDEVFIPSIPTMEGFGAYIHTKKSLEKLGIAHLGIANMVHRGIFGVMKEERVVIEKMEEKGKFWGVVPYDRAVVRAGLNHKIAVAEYPKSQFARAIMKLKEVV